MKKIFAYLQQPQVHAALSLLAQMSVMFFPQYSDILNQLAMAGTYGAVVTVGAKTLGAKT